MASSATAALFVVIALLCPASATQGHFSIARAINAIGEVKPVDVSSRQPHRRKTSSTGKLFVRQAGGGRRRKSPAPAPTSQTINIEFGGAKHATIDQGSYGEFRARPESVKSMECTSAGCQSCSNPNSCFHGISGGWGVGSPGSWGYLTLAVEPGTSFTHYTADVWAHCKTNEGSWSVWSTSDRVSNGVLSVYVHGDDGQKQVIKENWKPSGDGEYLDLPGLQQGSSRLQIVFHPDISKASKAEVYIQAWRVDEAVDDCMGVKSCLQGLGDGSDEGFELRNGNDKQLKCLQGTTQDMSDALRQKCNVWATCLGQTGRKAEILGLISAASKEFPALIAGNSTRWTDSDDCINPSIDDPESWNCQCAAIWAAACGSDVTCLNELMCGHASTCCSWKQDHCASKCPETSMLRSDVQMSSASLMNMRERKRRTSSDEITAGRLTQASGFDSALEGKCMAG